MKNVSITTLILFVTGILFTASTNAQTQLTEAVDFHVKTPEGMSIYLFPILDNENKIVVIDFFSTACGYCQTYAPDFQSSYENFGENGGNVYFMNINYGSDNAAVESFDSIFGLTMPTASGTQGGGNIVFNDYQIQSYPTVIVITPDHNIFNQYIWPPDTQTIDSVVVAAGGIMVNVEKKVNTTPSISIFPNPASSYSTLKISENKSSFIKFDISDTYGTIIYYNINNKIKNSETEYNLPIGNLQSGIYFVRIYKNSNIFTVKRLIIKH